MTEREKFNIGSRLERLATVKHSSLLFKFTDYVGNLQML
jgi:hypothetical protein